MRVMLAGCVRSRRALLGLLAALPLVAAAACTPDFEESWDVRDLRFLALQAEPPELLYRELPVALLSADEDEVAPVAPVRLRALAVDPRDPAREIAWELWACTPEATGCAEAERRWPVARVAEGACQVLPEDAAVPRQEARLDALGCDFVPTLALLRASLEADPYRGFGGVPLMVELRLLEGSQPVSVHKRLVYTVPLPYSPVPASKEANRNPELAAIEIDGESWSLERLATESPRFPPAAERELLPVPAPEAKERYWVVTTGSPGAPADLGRPPGEAQLEEILSYEFYTTAGAFSSGRTGGSGSAFFTDKKVADPSSTWTAPAAALSAPVRFWIVIRDDRGGSSWVSFEASVEEGRAE